MPNTPLKSRLVIVAYMSEHRGKPQRKEKDLYDEVEKSIGFVINIEGTIIFLVL